MDKGHFGQYLKNSMALMEATVLAIDDRAVEAAVETIAHVLKNGKPMLICGNGGSASDAMHITGELVGRYLIERRPFKVICLSDNPAVLTALSNDYSYATVFARQVEAYAEPGGVLLGLSTSGNSENVVRAFGTSRAKGMANIALTGQGGGKLAPLADHLFAVPSKSTPMIQQVHICLYHFICEAVERRLA